MNIEELREYCISKENVEECFPFDDETLVFKVNSKIFALIALEKPLNITLKCDPELSRELREKYPGITPAYHMNKNHWNTLHLANYLPVKLIFELIDHSYMLVSKKR